MWYKKPTWFRSRYIYTHTNWSQQSQSQGKQRSFHLINGQDYSAEHVCGPTNQANFRVVSDLIISRGIGLHLSDINWFLINVILPVSFLFLEQCVSQYSISIYLHACVTYWERALWRWPTQACIALFHRPPEVPNVVIVLL